MNIKRELAKKRSQFYREIRSYFDALDYVETETPILSESLIPESAIEVFESKRILSNNTYETVFLTPSPEIYMKILISEGIGDCYQLTKSFRNVEDRSRKHSNEFTMLEWYGMDIDYKNNIEITKNLLRHLSKFVDQESVHLFTEFTEVTMNDLFKEYVSIDLEQSESFEAFKKNAMTSGFQEYADKSFTWEELFNFIFVSHIENKLPNDKTVFIKDYPAQIATTAKRSGAYYERWEFYMKGWEIANCYTEEARYSEMLSLFQSEEKIKNEMKVPHPVNYDYLNIFKDNNFPMCSGAALGVDRLFAVAMNSNSLEEIALFY